MAARRRPSYLSPFAYARRNGLYKGLLGGDRTWLVLGGSVWAMRFLRKALGKTEEVVTVERLDPGQTISIRAIPQKTRAQRKVAAAENEALLAAAKRSAKVKVKAAK